MLSLFFFINRLCRLISIFSPGQDAKLIVFSLKNKGKTYRSTPRFGETYTTVTALCSFFDLFPKSTALYSGRNFYLFI